ncbi:DUF423 domain-containing protein [Phenylobacterium sp. LH3H17]|uniref:DUF423 domain-containing protein n=1 Tax=Phenylobacterium sp. LH3H17 TaxID=2903901 RepID=UPI0020CA17C8|nr:DUF423 domain-containing protein [Phenylobacterium sp. LH3H17]UTP38362.1 DUF423 domain-containing protein [Phenylobacterium sp. LH3H17]
MRIWLILAALGGLLAVGFGAFGAHGVTDPKAREWLQTGTLYAFVHCLAVFASARVKAPLAPPLFLSGVLVFSGSLYAMALGAPRILGAITPIGGLLFLAGWLMLGRGAWKPQA